MTLNRREAEKGSGDWSPGGFGIVAMRPLCEIQHGGNRKERLRVREAGASAAGRGQRPYASFPDVIPKRGMGCDPNVAPVTPNREAIQEARIRERSVSDSANAALSRQPVTHPPNAPAGA